VLSYDVADCSTQSRKPLVLVGNPHHHHVAHHAIASRRMQAHNVRTVRSVAQSVIQVRRTGTSGIGEFLNAPAQEAPERAVPAIVEALALS